MTMAPISTGFPSSSLTFYFALSVIVLREIFFAAGVTEVRPPDETVKPALFPVGLIAEQKGVYNVWTFDRAVVFTKECKYKGFVPD